MKPQTFAAVAGSIVTATGVMGMISPLRKTSFDRRDELTYDSGYGKIGGFIPTNDIFNWVRVGVGVLGLMASRNRRNSIIYNRSLAIAYGGMAIMGFIPRANTTFGLMPIFGGNIVLHAGTAAAELLTENNVLSMVGRKRSFAS